MSKVTQLTSLTGTKVQILKLQGASFFFFISGGLGDTTTLTNVKSNSFASRHLLSGACHKFRCGASAGASVYLLCWYKSTCFTGTKVTPSHRAIYFLGPLINFAVVPAQVLLSLLALLAQKFKF
jgi:hypothetical protein